MTNQQFFKIQAAGNQKKKKKKIYIYIYKLNFQKMFKNKGLDIIVNCNMKIVNYLGVTLKLNNGSYRLYKDPN